MRILVDGTGLLGSLFVARLQTARHDVAIVARGQRFTDIESYYGVHWDAAMSLPARQAGEVRTTSALEVDPILASAFSAVLKCQKTHQT
jgi:ketopantoate reductase